jgi:hypothetical protein
VTASVAVALVARGVVAGTLATAAIAKWRDVAGTRASLRALHLPVSLDRTLPVIEAFTALGLIVELRTAWAAYVACGLVAVFTVFVAVLVVRGVRAPCPCFGATAGTPTTGRTLARNILLLAVAVLGTARATSDHWLIVVVAVATAAVVFGVGRRSATTAAARPSGA